MYIRVIEIEISIISKRRCGERIDKVIPEGEVTVGFYREVHKLYGTPNIF